MIAAWELGAYLGEEGLARGVRARVSSWRRIGHDALIPNAKGTGQYLNSVLAKQEALAAGYDDGIFLSDTGHLVEGTGENIFLVSGGVVRTPDPGVGALPGITRESVMTLLRDHDIEVEESSLTRSDLYAADEAFFTGTAAEVTPIREIDDRPLAAPGPITKRAQELYMSAVRGELDGYRRWLDFA